jgi:hypothetical protein
MFDVALLRDFTVEYSVQDFVCLIRDNDVQGFIDDDAMFEAAMFLMYDYQEGRANAFAYADGIHDARILLEMRKSAILYLADDFFEEHPDDSVENIKKYRSAYLIHFLEDYQDDNWQYWWACHLLTKRGCQEWLEFGYESLLVDGNPELDNFPNPLKQKVHQVVYGHREFFRG